MTTAQLLVIVLLLLLVFGAFPRWGYNRDWGYRPFGGTLVIVVIILIVLLLL